MRPLSIALLTALLATPMAPAHAASPAPLKIDQSAPLVREVVPLESGWSFHFGANGEAPAAVDFDDSGWERVSVPYTWNRIGEYALERSGTTNNAQGVGWYRLTLQAPAAPEGMRQYLDFAAVGTIADVWVMAYMSARTRARSRAFGLMLPMRGSRASRT